MTLLHGRRLACRRVVPLRHLMQPDAWTWLQVGVGQYGQKARAQSPRILVAPSLLLMASRKLRV